MENRSLFTSQFLVLCLSSFFFFMSFNSVLPELIIYLDEELGSAHLSGWVLALFTLVAGLSRPISGKITDTVGRLPVLIVGGLVGTIAAVAYAYIDDIAHVLPVVGAVAVFFGIRAFHGFSTGFKPTATAALLADIIPSHRVGEGMGWLGFAGSIGMAAGPKLGNYLHLNYGYNTMFWAAAILSLLSVVTIIGLKETLPKNVRQPLNLQVLNVRMTDVYEPLVLSPTITFVFYAMAFGAVFTLIPIKTSILGLDDQRGTFFLVYLGFTALSRIFAGKVSDRVGRTPVILVGIVVVIAAMLLLGTAQTVLSLMIGGALYGIAHGTVSPALFAWTADLSDPRHKGRGFSTMFIGMEIGIGSGALLSSWIYNISHQSTWPAFAVMALFSVIAFVFTWSVQRRTARQLKLKRCR